MKLPERRACFACGGDLTRVLWQDAQIALASCRTCDAEWLQGNAPREQAYHYGDREGEGLAGRYHSGRARRCAAYLAAFPMPTGDLLDIGCGTGQFLVESKAMGWRPVGLELDERAARAARARSGVPIVAGDLTDTPLFRAQSFDLLTLWGVLEHVPEPEGLLRVCRGLLRPGGMLLLETPSSQGMFRRVARLTMTATGGRFTRAFRETITASHIVWYSPRGLRAAAHRLGLRVVDLQGSRNSTEILVARFAGLPLVRRFAFQAATAVLNKISTPLGLANQILAALQLPVDPV